MGRWKAKYGIIKVAFPLTFIYSPFSFKSRPVPLIFIVPEIILTLSTVEKLPFFKVPTKVFVSKTNFLAFFMILTLFEKSKGVQKAAVIAESAIGIAKMIISNKLANAGALTAEGMDGVSRQFLESGMSLEGFKKEELLRH